MKKTIGLTFLCLLGACATPPSQKLTPQSIAPQNLKGTIDGAPFPWLHIIPSERTAIFTEIDFNEVSRLIRYSMSSCPKKFDQVTLVLVDYTILPLKDIEGIPSYAHQGVKYCQDYVRVPMRYMVRLSFYKCNRRPPHPPSFVGTALLSPSSTPVYESIRHMTYAIMDELYVSSLNEIFIHLDMDPMLTQKMKEKYGLSGHFHQTKQPGRPHSHHSHHPHHHAHPAISKHPKKGGTAPGTPPSSSSTGKVPAVPALPAASPTPPSAPKDTKPAAAPSSDGSAPPDTSTPAPQKDTAPVRGIVA